MAIGRSFQEALQKACQSLEIKRNGLGADGKENTNQAELLAGLERPSWNRLFMIYDAMKLGISIKTIQKLTRIDMWFLQQIEEMIALCRKGPMFSEVKQIGFEWEERQEDFTDFTISNS